MKCLNALSLVCLVSLVSLFTASNAWSQSADEVRIRTLSTDFCQAAVAGDLTVLDRMFDASPTNVFYDINEGPLVGLDRLKRVWGAAVRNSRLTGFSFKDDVQILLEADKALQTGSWTQTQTQADGSSRQIDGRATILWRKVEGDWKVYHYHASVTPPRPQRPQSQ